MRASAHRAKREVALRLIGVPCAHALHIDSAILAEKEQTLRLEFDGVGMGLSFPGEGCMPCDEEIACGVVQLFERTLGTHMATPREDIVAAARGGQPMDLVVRGAHLENVFTTEIYPADIGIKGDRFAAVLRYEDGRPEYTAALLLGGGTA